jgi:hypothetical protein
MPTDRLPVAAIHGARPEPVGDALSGSWSGRACGRNAAVTIAAHQRSLQASAIYVASAVRRRSARWPGWASRAKRLAPRSRRTEEASRRAGRASDLQVLRRARLFLQAVRCVRPRRGAMSRLRRPGQANRPGRPLDLLLPELPEIGTAIAAGRVTAAVDDSHPRR